MSCQVGAVNSWVIPLALGIHILTSILTSGFMESKYTQVSVWSEAVSLAEWSGDRGYVAHKITAFHHVDHSRRRSLSRPCTMSPLSPGRLWGFKIHRIISRYPTCLFKISLAIDIQIVLLSAESSKVIPVGTHIPAGMEWPRHVLVACRHPWLQKQALFSESVGRALFLDSSLMNYESEMIFS